MQQSDTRFPDKTALSAVGHSVLLCVAGWYRSLLLIHSRGKLLMLIISICLIGPSFCRSVSTSLAWTDSSHLAQQQYPPYPDVWHRVIPGPKYEYRYLEVFLTQAGDYLIAYNKGDTRFPDGTLILEAIHFFSGRILDNVHGNDLVPPKYQLLPGQLKITLPQGLSIALRNLDRRQPQRCPQTLNHYYLIEDTHRGTSENKSLLYVLDHPRQAEIAERCVDTIETTYEEKVVAIQGWFVPLPDGEVLIYNSVDGGIVLRLDAHLQSRSPLMQTKLFWVDTSVIRQWRKEGDVDYQRMHNELLHYLRNEVKQ